MSKNKLKKTPKNALKLFLLCVMLFFVTSFGFAYAQNEVQNPSSDNNQNMELVQTDVRVDDPDIEPINVNEVKKSVVPDTQKEGKKVLMLFLKAMFTVLICAIFLYFLLILIKKNWKEAFVETKTDEVFEELDLSSPNNKKEALRSFLNRTK